VAFLTVLLGTPVVWIKGQSEYLAESVVQVSPRFAHNLKPDVELEFQSNSQFRQFVQHQARTINRYDIVLEALEGLGENRGIWQPDGETSRRAAERLQAALNIRAVPDTYLITVGLNGAEPTGLDKIVNAVTEVYLRKAKEEEIYGKDRRIENLENEKEEILQSLPRKADRKTEIAQQLGVTTFSPSFLNPYDRLLITAKEALSGAVRERIRAESELAVWDSSKNSQSTDALRSAALVLATSDPGLNSLKASLNERRSRLLQKMSGLTPQHKGRKAVERELDEIGNELNRATDELVNSTAEMLLDQKRTAFFEALRIEEQLRNQVEVQTREASQFSYLYQKALTLDYEIEKLRNHLSKIDDRISFLSLESAAPGFTRLVSPARPAEIPVKGGRRKLFLALLMGACGLGLASPYAFVLLDPRVRVPADVEKVVGVPALGWIPKGTGPESRRLAEDQIRRISAAFKREHEKNGSKVFSLTGAESDQDTRAISTAIARDLSELGIEPLLIGVDPSEATEAFKPTDVPSEDTFERVSNPRYLRIGCKGSDGLSKVHEILRQSRMSSEGSQVVILDLPPILDCAECELLVEESDVAVLVALSGSLGKDRIRRSAAKLERIEASVVAFVLDQVNPGDVI
jgi:capsular polysaccharide biosynthesis protein